VTAALAFEEVTLRYPGVDAPVVERLSLVLEPGERVALLGLNGAGKTTLLRSVVGLIPHEGTISVGGTEVTSRTLRKVREQVGFLFNVPEDQLLFPRVLDDVSYGLRRRGQGREAASRRAQALLVALGIADLADRQVYDLSHGQKLRVALAGVLVLEPAILLLDEPTAGLDPPGRQQLAHLLARQPAAILVATHDLSFVEAFCHRQVLLAEGGAVEEHEDLEAVRSRWGISGC